MPSTYLNDTHLSAASGGGNTYAPGYDAFGRCVKRAVNGVATYYVYDGEKPIVEFKAGGSLAGKRNGSVCDSRSIAKLLGKWGQTFRS